MDVGDGEHEVDKSRPDSSTLPEFKLNRRYRDTLALHGRARGEPESLSMGEIPTGEIFSTQKTCWSFSLCVNNSASSEGSTSGRAKVRRAIEHLRTDVVKGLGVKLLDKVIDIMEEEDEDKREVSEHFRRQHPHFHLRLHKI